MSLHLPNFVDCVFSYANTVKFSECNLWILLNVGGPGRHAGRAGVKNMIEHVHSTRALLIGSRAYHANVVTS